MNAEARGGATESTEVPARLDELSERMKDQLSAYDARLRDFVQEHPVATVLGAAALGYFIGRLLSRR